LSEKPDYQIDEDAYWTWHRASGEEKLLAAEKLYPILQRYARSIIWRRLDWDERNSVYDLADRAVAIAMSSRSYLGQAKFTTWFYAVTNNLVNRWLTAERRHRRSEVDFDMEIVPTPETALDAWIMLGQIRQRCSPDEQAILDYKLDGPNTLGVDGDASKAFCEARKWRWVDTANNELEVRWKQLKRRLRRQHLAAS
jgi:hypothetical protein